MWKFILSGAIFCLGLGILILGNMVTRGAVMIDLATQVSALISMFFLTGIMAVLILAFVSLNVISNKRNDL